MAISIFSSVRAAMRLVALGAVIGCSTWALAEQPSSIYGDAYQRDDGVVAEQAQIVMFRGNDDGKQAAHIYIDGHLQSALMPGGYTVFCTSAGQHSVESYIGDAPVYAGKRNPQSYAKLTGGETYILEAPTQPNQSTPIVHTGKDADQRLQGLRRQVHVLNRAASVVPCQTLTKQSLRSDVLFTFGKSSYSDITEAGHEELRKLAQSLKSQQVDSVEVAGHADPIGSADYNWRLSEARAQTIRQALLQLGIGTETIRAVGYGSSRPVVHCDSGSRSARIACNAPNRRVDLIVHGRSES